MDDKEYRAFLNLMMCSDPWPASNEDATTLEKLADREAKARGYDSWYVAYHDRAFAEPEQPE